MSEEYVKNFESWNTYKDILNETESNGFFHEREIWWCALGINIGSEQDGKNELFERPILIVRKISTELVLIAPITSKIGSYEDRVTTHIAGKESQILIAQIRVVSSKRLLRKIERIKTVRFQEVLIGLVKFILERESETPP